MDNIKVISVIGTNASGKSSIGIDLAKKFNGEIISADSRQVYRGFDLCSGKVTVEECRIIPHHLINIIDIGDSFSVSDFQKYVYTLVPQITARGKIPFIVGGTGLYIDSVVKGYKLYESTPDYALREALEVITLDELMERLPPKGLEYLKDKPADMQNKRRIIRLIEKISHDEPLNFMNAPKYNVLQLGVTWPKDILYSRIDERLRDRINQGMIDEVRSYLNNNGDRQYLYNLGLEYRYVMWYLNGKFSTEDEFFSEMSRAIKRFAKKQMTWFKRDNTIQWLDMLNDPLSQAENLINIFLNT